METPEKYLESTFGRKSDKETMLSSIPKINSSGSDKEQQSSSFGNDESIESSAKATIKRKRIEKPISSSVPERNCWTPLKINLLQKEENFQKYFVDISPDGSKRKIPSKLKDYIFIQQQRSASLINLSSIELLHYSSLKSKVVLISKYIIYGRKLPFVEIIIL